MKTLLFFIVVLCQLIINMLSVIVVPVTYATDYLVIVEMGTPPQQFMSILDTGSCFVVVNTCLESETGCYTPYYQNATSNSYANTNYNVTLNYGTNTKTSGAAQIGTDTINLNGLELSNFTFALMPSSSSAISSFSEGAAAPFGLCQSYSYYNKSGLKPAESFVNSLYKRGVIPLNLFSLYVDLKTNTGNAAFGAYDTSKTITWIDTVTTTNSNSAFYWELPVVSFFGVPVNNSLPSVPFVIDSGAVHMDIPSSYNTPSFLSLFTNSPYSCYQNTTTLEIMCTCTSLSDMNPVPIVIDTTTFTLQPSGYASCSSTKCTTKFMFTTQSILGNAFLKNFYTVFDYTNNRIGFNLVDQSAPNYSSATSSTTTTSTTTTSTTTTSTTTDSSVAVSIITSTSSTEGATTSTFMSSSNSSKIALSIFALILILITFS